MTDTVSGRDLNNRDRFLVRGQLLIKPNEDLSIRLIGDYNQKNEECCAAAILAPLQNLSRDASGNVVSSPNTIAGLVRSLGGVYNVPTDGKKYAYLTALTPGGRLWPAHPRLGCFRPRSTGIWAPGTLTSITGYREFKNQSGQDADFNKIDLLRRDDQNRKFQTFSQELRFQGVALNDRLDYLVGGYYAHETLRTDDNLIYGNDFERYYNAQFAGFNAAFGAANTASS